ncbi:low-specificity L-threonine aldolase [Malassezia nana]|uniref:Low-specificity L-threonine aldolase n=1 Tax=Malassezia nana TaxID=180528 RepID=A0AAF0J442_9BASI|nr:low-specificity L-threonine aldolase [Malassezia nana]
MPEAEPMRHAVTVQIPCPDEATATTIQQVLWVDRELRPRDVVKVAQVQNRSEACVLDVLSLNAFLEDAALVVRTMDTFRAKCPDMTATDAPLEQGSVGRAG